MVIHTASSSCTRIFLILLLSLSHCSCRRWMFLASSSPWKAISFSLLSDFLASFWNSLLRRTSASKSRSKSLIWKNKMYKQVLIRLRLDDTGWTWNPQAFQVTTAKCGLYPSYETANVCHYTQEILSIHLGDVLFTLGWWFQTSEICCVSVTTDYYPRVCLAPSLEKPLQASIMVKN